MALLYLPNETLLKILSFLPVQDLANTCLVSHHLHDLSLLPLHRHIVVSVTTDRETTSAMALRLRTLRHSITARVSYTRSLQLHDESWEHYNAEYGLELAKLLELLPHLEFLELRAHFWPTDSESDAFPDCLLSSPSPARLPAGLKSIREFRALAIYDTDAVSVDLLILLMALPNIRILTARVCDDEDGKLLFPGTSGTSGITELELPSSLLSEEMLAGILKIPRSLISFVYRPIHLFSLRIVMFRQALQSLQESLVHLVVDFTGIESDYDCDDDWPIGSFRNWKRLETLDCPLLLLFGGDKTTVQDKSLADEFPVCLKTLRIRDDQFWKAEEVVKQVVLFLQHDLPTIGLGMLRKVGVGEIPAGSRDVLVNACEAAGVEFIE